MRGGKVNLKAAMRADQRRRMKVHALGMALGKTPNEIAAAMPRAFIQTPEWRALRLTVLAKYGTRCMKCQTVPKRKSQVNVDHIKCRLYFPELALVFDNLQVLCGSCNKAKGNKHSMDYRPAQ